MNSNQFKDIQFSSAIPGFLALIVIFCLNIVLGYLAFSFFQPGTIIPSIVCGFLFLVSLFLYSGLTTINPGQAVILVFFGDYVGTMKDTGYFWINPLYSGTNVTIKQVNQVTDVLKINDATGNPIEVAATITYRDRKSTV